MIKVQKRKCPFKKFEKIINTFEGPFLVPLLRCTPLTLLKIKFVLITFFSVVFDNVLIISGKLFFSKHAISGMEAQSSNVHKTLK